MKLGLIFLFTIFMMVGCGDETEKKVDKAVDYMDEKSEDIGESLDKTADDMRRKVCETIDGKLECWMEDVERDVEEELDDSPSYSE